MAPNHEQAPRSTAGRTAVEEDASPPPTAQQTGRSAERSSVDAAGDVAVARIAGSRPWTWVFGMIQPSALVEALRGEAAAGRLRPLVRALSHEQHVSLVQPALLRMAPLIAPADFAALAEIFFGSEPREAGTMRVAFSLRFNLRLGADLTPVCGVRYLAWDAPGLMRAWRALEQLPSSHVVGGDTLDHFARFDGQASGWYSGEESAIGMAYEWREVLTLNGAYTEAQSNPDASSEAEAYNYFDSMVRHEIGHAVDAALHVSDTYGRTPAGGGWDTHGGTPELAAESLLAAVGVVGLPEHRALALRTSITALINANLDTSSDLQCGGTAATVWSMEVFRQQFADLQDAPYFHELVEQLRAIHADGSGQAGARAPREVGGRCFIRGYAGYLISFDGPAYARRVSDYQFRAPGEWFAEAYAAYFNPDHPGGAALKSRDPTTWAFIRDHVAKKPALLKNARVGPDQAARPGAKTPAAGG